MKKALIIIVILGCLAGLVLGGNTLLENAYWAGDAGTGIADVSRHQDDIMLSKELNAEMHQYFQENYDQHMREPNDAELAVIQTCKGYVIDYYWDTYQVDLSQRIQSVEPFLMDFSFMNDYYGCNIAGYYDSNGHFLAVTDDDMYSLEDPSLLSAIIHELVHASGVCEDDVEFITEGFTEAVTNRIMTRNGLYFSELGPYYPY